MKKKKSFSIIIILILLVSIITLTISYSNKNDDISKIEEAPDGLVLIHGGKFEMGSPETEKYRNDDEVEHEVEVSDFYISQYEVTQAEFEEIMGYNPSYFRGDNLPVENISWYEAIKYCNLLSKTKGLTPVYKIEEDKITWDLSADGYRLPTEAEWEYASRAGTITPFNTENSISTNEANYNGNFPYEIEDYYFEQDKLATKPGEYRQKTIAVGSLSSNAWGLYDMHGNVAEWVYDYYDEYNLDSSFDTETENGKYKVVRGGGWNDAAKHLRNAYRSIVTPSTKSASIGFRMARNVTGKNKISITKQNSDIIIPSQNILIVYFSWDGETEKIAELIKQNLTSAELYKIEINNPYSNNYNEFIKETILEQQKERTVELVNLPENLEEYDTILIGVSNWWSSLPLPITLFLEEYNLAGKTIVPFSIHNGNYSGQIISEIAKLVPYSILGPNLNISDSDENYETNIINWLQKLGLIIQE